MRQGRSLRQNLFEGTGMSADDESFIVRSRYPGISLRAHLDKMRSALWLLAVLFCGADAFAPLAASGPRVRSLQGSTARAGRPVAVVVEISSTEELNEALEKAGDALVVVDYSTSWCGPCKIIAPKFDEYSERYQAVTFLKVRALVPMSLSNLQPLTALTSRSFVQVMGDSCASADKLMRSQGVRALPSFHFVSSPPALPRRSLLALTPPTPNCSVPGARAVEGQQAD